MTFNNTYIKKEGASIIAENSEKKKYIKNISLIKTLADIFNQEIEYNKIKNLKKLKKDLFYSEEMKNNSIESYISKIVKQLEIERSTLILSYVSIKKFLRKSKNYLSLKNFCKLFLISCFVNAKYNEDLTFSIKKYMKISQLTKKEIILLEKEFYRVIDYSLFVDEKTYREYDNFFSEKEKEL